MRRKKERGPGYKFEIVFRPGLGAPDKVADFVVARLRKLWTDASRCARSNLRSWRRATKEPVTITVTLTPRTRDEERVVD